MGSMIRKEDLKKLQNLKKKIGKDIGDETKHLYNLPNSISSKGIEGKIDTYEDQLQRQRKKLKNLKKHSNYSNILMDFNTFVTEKNKPLRDIIITIPKSIKWSDYEKELEKAEQGEIMNFKVSNFPKTGKGCKCYIVHDGYIRGYMIIHDLTEKEFVCTTTNKNYKGKFVERTGKFHKIEPLKMKGFQGFRYY